MHEYAVMSYLLEPDPLPAASPAATVEGHALDPLTVLRLVQKLGGSPPRLLVVGCEPATFGPEGEGQMGLSAPVAAALDGAVRLVEKLVGEFIGADQVASVADA